MIAGFSFDRRCKEWREQNGVDDAYMEKFETEDLESVISTIKDVQALMSYGWDFGVKYKNCEAYFSGTAQQFNIDAERDGQTYECVLFDLDDFENAKVGPYRLSDIVDKWTITDFL